jgi:SAM-dependent methyltransferase
VRGGDRWLQRWRIARARRWIQPGDRLLDVGCFDRTLLSSVEDRVASATGIDAVAEPYEAGRVRVLRGRFPEDARFEPDSFDRITLLAVLEHAPDPAALARELFRIQAPAGQTIVTVPSAVVDPVLDVLRFLRVVDGMDLEAHHGYEVRRTPDIFEEAGFRLVAWQRFQLGLNNLFVFQKPD